MQDLIARLKAASGADRGLDEAIAVALHMPRAVFGPIFDQLGMVDGPEYHADAGHWSGNGMTWRAPDFTSSLDVALTLVPENWTAAIEAYPASQLRGGRGAVTLWDGAELSRSKVLIGQVLAPTPALALCIAALKARTTLMGSQQKVPE